MKKSKNKKVNILGTEYSIEFVSEKDECMVAMNSVGYTDK